MNSLNREARVERVTAARVPDGRARRHRRCARRVHAGVGEIKRPGWPHLGVEAKHLRSLCSAARARRRRRAALGDPTPAGEFIPKGSQWIPACAAAAGEGGDERGSSGSAAAALLAASKTSGGSSGADDGVLSRRARPSPSFAERLDSCGVSSGRRPASFTRRGRRGDADAVGRERHVRRGAGSNHGHRRCRPRRRIGSGCRLERRRVPRGGGEHRRLGPRGRSRRPGLHRGEPTQIPRRARGEAAGTNADAAGGGGFAVGVAFAFAGAAAFSAAAAARRRRRRRRRGASRASGVASSRAAPLVRTTIVSGGEPADRCAQLSSRRHVSVPSLLRSRRRSMRRARGYPAAA